MADVSIPPDRPDAPMPVDFVPPAILAILFVATLTRSTFGFGEALVAMPLLAMVVEFKMAVALVALVSSTTTVGMIAREWRGVQIRPALLLAAAAYVGIPLGLYYLTRVDERTVKAILAGLIILFCVYRLAGGQSLALRTDRTACLFGFFAGLLGGAYNTHGPPLVVFGSLRNWPPDRFRATLQGYFLLTCAAVLGGHYYKGWWTPRVLFFFLTSIPIVILSLYLGSKLNRHLNGRCFVYGIHGLLIAIAIVLLVTSLWPDSPTLRG